MKKALLFINLILLLFITFQAESQCGAGATITTTASKCVSTGTMNITNASAAGTLWYSFSSWPPSYSYSGITNNPNFNTLYPGTYVVVISDSNLISTCSTTYTITIVDSFVTPVLTSTSTATTGCDNGTISASITGGQAPYHYTLTGGSLPTGITNTSGFFSGLESGLYTISADDSCQFTLTNSISVANSSWNIISNTSNQTGCTQYQMNSVTLSGSPVINHYTIKEGTTILTSGTSLPIPFNTPDSTLGMVWVCVTDNAGCEKCEPISTPTSWFVAAANVTYPSCDHFVLDSISIVGSPPGPLVYGLVTGLPAPIDTIWSSTLPIVFNHVPYENKWGLAVVKDGCGKIKKSPFSSTNYMGMSGAASSFFTDCNIGSITVGALNRYRPPVTFSLNGGTPVTTGLFTNLPDGNYSITIMDSCGETKTLPTVTLDHHWQSFATVSSDCSNNGFFNHIKIVYRMKAPIVIQQYNSTYTTLISTQTYTNSGTFIPSPGPSDVKSEKIFTAQANTTYEYILTDDCGRKDTVEVVNDPYIHVPNTIVGTVQKYCNNKGKITAHYSYDGPSTNPVILSLWKINTPLTPIVNNFYTGQTIGSLTWGNGVTGLDTGTYVIKMEVLNCNEINFDTVTIEPYYLPYLQYALAFTCNADTVNCIGWGEEGIPPYNYEIVLTIPSGGEQPIQSSNIFTLTGGPYSMIRMKVWDACGNGTTHEMSVATPLPLTIHSTVPLPQCNLDSLTLFVDSIFPGNVYHWYNPSGVIVSSNRFLTIHPVSLADTGVYHCRVTIPGICFDVTSVFHLRAKDLICYARLGNFVWDDTNQNGIKDSDEVGVAGITVTLYDSTNRQVAATVTDAYGYYMFNKLNAGSYHVGFSLPANYMFTTANVGSNDLIDSDPEPSSGMTADYIVQNGDIITTADAGIHLAHTTGVGNYVWNDLNQNGIQDGNEIGISGVVVTLFNSSSIPIATTITDAFGHYYFSDLSSGVYKLGFAAPVAYLFSAFHAGSDITKDNDVLPGTGLTDFFSLATGENNLSIDAGLYVQNSTKASVGNFVWFDNNQNGIQDIDEKGVPGVIVTLYASNATTVLASTISNELGYYIFNNLSSGDYVIGFSQLPASYAITTLHAGTDSTIDSDVLISTSKTSLFHVNANDRLMCIDAGISNPSANLGIAGHKVWYDYNEDGIMNGNENGTPGVTVTLYSSGGTAVLQTTVTDQHGNYLFNHIGPGTYLIGFSNLPPGYIFTKALQGSDPSKDSDPDVLSGKTSSFVLTLAGSNLTLDAGIIKSHLNNATASLGDKVWLDANQNGLHENSEFGVQDVVVNLYDAITNSVIASKITDALGNYMFTNLSAGSYKVGFNLPTGYTFSSTNTGTNDSIDNDVNSSGMTGVYQLVRGDDNLTVDAGIYGTPNMANVGNLVWNDLNKNGIQNLNEPGVAGITVSLFDLNNVLIMSTTSNSKGAYQFSDLQPGSYYIEFSNLPVGYQFTNPQAGGLTSSNSDSDPDPITGATSIFTLSAGQQLLSIDAGIYTDMATLGNYVWNDLDENGIQGIIEKGLPGITVKLLDASTLSEISTYITDANGNYSFVNLLPGNYLIEVSGMSEASTFSIPFQGVDSTLDSDINPFIGTTNTFSLNTGNFYPKIDAAIQTTIATGLGDFVWFDENANGIQDGNEKGLAGVTVTVYNGSIHMQCAVTDQNGYYTFPNLQAGNYNIEYATLPSGRIFTAPNIGSDDSSDCDIVSTIMSGPFAYSGKTAPYNLLPGMYNSGIDAGLKLLFPLPLHALTAEASLTGSTTHVSWITLDEKSLLDFDVQRSLDAISFDNVEKVKARGTTIGYYKYVINDEIDNLMSEPVIYYRIVANDIDGNKSYSNIVSVHPDKDDENVMVYPSPFSNMITINYPSIHKSRVTITLRDVHAKLISSRNVKVEPGINLIQLNDLSALSKGTYMIQISEVTNGKKFVRLIVKE